MYRVPLDRSSRVVMCLLTLLLVACSAAGPTSAPREQGGPGTTGSNGLQPSTKSLQIALQGFQEPKGGIVDYGSAGAGGFDPLEHYLMFHASLTVYDQRGQLVPRLAEKLPSTTDGDWN